MKGFDDDLTQDEPWLTAVLDHICDPDEPKPGEPEVKVEYWQGRKYSNIEYLGQPPASPLVPNLWASSVISESDYFSGMRAEVQVATSGYWLARTTTVRTHIRDAVISQKVRLAAEKKTQKLHPTLVWLLKEEAGLQPRRFVAFNEYEVSFDSPLPLPEKLASHVVDSLIILVGARVIFDYNDGSWDISRQPLPQPQPRFEGILEGEVRRMSGLEELLYYAT